MFENIGAISTLISCRSFKDYIGQAHTPIDDLGPIPTTEPQKTTLPRVPLTQKIDIFFLLFIKNL